MPVKQKDIAARANVSSAAVSKVLANPSHPEFPADTRARILDAAQKLNYIPNRMAANLRRGKSSTLSLLSAWNVPELQDSVAQAAKEYDLGVMLQFSQDGDHAALARAVEAVLSDQPAGLIWLPGWGSEDHQTHPDLEKAQQQVRRVGCPVVWLEDDPPWERNSDFVWCDDTAGVHAAVDHFIDQGYQQFVFMVGERANQPRPLRWSIFQQAVADRGFTARYIESGHHATVNDPIVHDLIRQCPDGTAILCEGDWPAVPVLHAAEQFNRPIPDEIGVLVFGDLHLAGGFSLGEVTRPRLSAVRRPFDQIGRTAVQRLHERIDGAHTGLMRSEQLPTQLIVRDSTRRQDATTQTASARPGSTMPDAPR